VDGALARTFRGFCSIGRVRSRIRPVDAAGASIFNVPTTPTFSPKLRKVARMSFSIAMAFDCSNYGASAAL
jgi:hypothetical protein